MGHREILMRFGIGFQLCAVGFIRSQTIEPNQTPRHIVGALVRKEIPDQVAAASRNDSAPILGVVFEGISLVLNPGKATTS